MRDVLLGADPCVQLTQRAAGQLTAIRDKRGSFMGPDATLIVRTSTGDDLRWWTWAGYRVNATLAATLSDIADPLQRHGDHYLPLREDLDPAMWNAGIKDARERLCLPDVNEKR